MLNKFILPVASILCLFITKYGSAQTCDCKSNFEWMKKTFEENDAGFKYILSIKGQAAYDYHNKIILEKINNVKDKKDCLPILQEWLRFFRKGHIYIQSIENNTTSTVPSQPIDTIAILNQFKNWPQKTIDTLEFKRYLNNKKTQDFEGIWESPPYKIAIKKNNNGYAGYLLNDFLPYWKAGQLKLEIRKDDGKWKGIAYMRDHSKVENDYVTSYGQNYLSVANFWLTRLAPKIVTEKEITDYFKTINTRTPYIELINKNTLYFRIPSFAPTQKKSIDSVLIANKDKLSTTSNLIIDIRNNGGGGDASFENILPYLFTNPTKEIGVDYLSTALNNQRMIDFLNNPDYKDYFDAKKRVWIKESYDKLQKHLGEFVSLEEPVKSDDVKSLNTKMSFPKQVGILINGGVASTSEQFLLAAKQSKKVKLFGITTFGSLDISNMYTTKSPCNEYELGYCLSRSKRIPDFIIDDRGIQPDYFIDNSVPDYKWVEFVKAILEQ